MSDDKKDSEVKEAPKAEKESKKDDAKKALKASKDAEKAAKAAAEAEAAAEAAIAKAKELKEAAAKASEEEFKAIAEEIKAEAPKAPDVTNKRKTEIIFRREMGEPEFFLDKADRFPKPILSEDEKDDITRKALNYEDTTPEYNPQNILDERFGGTSNYETGITVLGDELQEKLERLRNDPEALSDEIEKVEQDLSYLDSLHENYYLGMNVFRTAKGGRKN
jgi:colicin import membrane protein|tara:strand:- start:1027 stop:1689 length:663 start_codon:yes stop_codon:yes gene_type:complete